MGNAGLPGNPQAAPALPGLRAVYCFRGNLTIGLSKKMNRRRVPNKLIPDENRRSTRIITNSHARRSSYAHPRACAHQTGASLGGSIIGTPTSNSKLETSARKKGDESQFCFVSTGTATPRAAHHSTNSPISPAETRKAFIWAFEAVSVDTSSLEIARDSTCSS